jgi:hypothetical protein
MEAVSNFTFAASSLRLCVVFLDDHAREFVRCYQLYKLYRETGSALFFFGNRTTWRMQAQIHGQLKEDASAFKESVYNECTMIAV